MFALGVRFLSMESIYLKKKRWHLKCEKRYIYDVFMYAESDVFLTDDQSFAIFPQKCYFRMYLQLEIMRFNVVVYNYTEVELLSRSRINLLPQPP